MWFGQEPRLACRLAWYALGSNINGLLRTTYSASGFIGRCALTLTLPEERGLKPFSPREKGGDEGVRDVSKR